MNNNRMKNSPLKMGTDHIIFSEICSLSKTLNGKGRKMAQSYKIKSSRIFAILMVSVHHDCKSHSSCFDVYMLVQVVHKRKQTKTHNFWISSFHWGHKHGYLHLCDKLFLWHSVLLHMCVSCLKLKFVVILKSFNRK